MNINLLYKLLILKLLIICEVYSQCCNDKCKNLGNTLDCNGKCITENICEISDSINQLNFENNELGRRPNFIFPYQANIQKLNLGNNGLISTVPSTIFNSYVNLKALDLNGNPFQNATFLVPATHGLLKLTGVQANCLINLDKFINLKLLQVTIEGDNICNNILTSNVPKLELTMSKIHTIDGNKFDKLQNTISIKLKLPDVTNLHDDSFKHFTKIKELELDIPNLNFLTPKTLRNAVNLEKIVIKAPNLRIFPSNWLNYRDNEVQSKLNHLEFCPVMNIPDRLLVGQSNIKTVKLCGFENGAYIGIPSEILYNELSLSNSKYRTRGGSINSFTLYAIKDNRPTLDKNVKIKASAINLINMSLYNFDWSDIFDKHIVKYLNLQSNFLNAIDTEDLAGFEEILNLDLSNNNINFLSYTALRNLRKLRVLDLSNNNLEQIDFSMFNTRQLYSADFSNNKITTIIPEERGLIISQLYLRNNSLSNINEFMKKQLGLMYVSLYGNNIERFPDFLPVKLKKLDLRGNQFDCSCEFVGHIYSLTQKLIENDQIGIVNSLDYLTCQVNTSTETNILEASKLCVNITSSRNNFIFEIKNTSTGDHFFPSLGAMLKFKSYLVSGNDLVIASIRIKIPTIRLPYMVNTELIEEICQKEEEKDSVFCTVNLPQLRDKITESLRLRNEIKIKLKDLYNIAYNDYDNEPKRNKRFILTGLKVLSILTLNIRKVYSEYVVRKRVNAMVKAVQILQTDLLSNNDKVLTISKDLALYKSINEHNIERIMQHVNKLQKTVKEIADAYNTIFRETPYAYTTINNMQKYMRQNFMRERLFGTVESHISYYKDALLEVDQLINSMVELKKGVLPPKLVSPTQVKTIISKAEQLLAKERPDFKLVSKDAEFYYRLNNIAFSANIQLGLIIQIPLFITLKKLDFLQLYQFNFISLPLSDGQTTKLSSKNRYLGIHQNLYKTFTDDEFQLCEVHTSQNLYICPFQLTMTDKHIASCESLIYYKGNLEDIYKLCDIQLYPDHNMQKAEILHFDDKILLSHIHRPITWHCDDNNAVPDNKIDIDLNYTIISKSALCGCELRTKEFLIPKRSCLTNSESAKLHFVVNALAYMGLQSYINKNYSTDYIMELHDNQPNISLPVVDLEELGLNELLYQNENDVSLDFKDVVKLMNKEKIMESNELLDANKLFLGKYRLIGVSTILAVLGTIALFLVLCVCKRQFKIKKLLYALISQVVPLTEAKNKDIIIIRNWEEYAINLVIMVITIMLMQIIYLIMRKVCFLVYNAAPKLQIPKALENTKHSVIYLVLRSQDLKINIPLCKILIQSDLITLDKSFGIENIIVERCWLKHHLIIKWSAENHNIFIDSIKVKLPSKVPLSISNARKIRQIRRNNLLASLLLIDEKNIAHKLGCHLYTPSDIELLHSDNSKKTSAMELKEKKQLLLQKIENV